MAERRRVEVAQLGEREARRREREAEICVGEFCAETFAGTEEDLLVVVRKLRELVERMPARVLRHVRVDPARHQPEERGRELPPRRIAGRVAQRLQLLEMRDLLDVDLRGEVAAHRLLERLVRRQRPARAAPSSLRTARAPAARAAPAAVHRAPGERPRARHGLGFSPESRQPCTLNLEVIAYEAKTRGI